MVNSPSAPGIEPHDAPPAIAKALGVDPETVLSWIKSGQLTARRLGSGKVRPRYRVARSALEAFLKSRETTAPSRPQRQRKAKPAEVDYVAMMNLGGRRQ